MNNAHTIAMQWLAEWHTASLATVSDDGLPHACNIQFALVDEQLIFVSSPDSAHAGHIADSPRVAMTTYAHTQTPDQIHGVQLHGSVSVPSGDALARATDAYLRGLGLAPQQWQARVQSQTLYCVTPDWIRVIDNRRGFGFKLEWAAAADEVDA